MNPTILTEAGFATGEWSPQSLVNLVSQQMGVRLEPSGDEGPRRFDAEGEWEAYWVGAFGMPMLDEEAIGHVELNLRWAFYDWSSIWLEVEVDVLIPNHEYYIYRSDARGVRALTDEDFRSYQKRRRDLTKRHKTLPRLIQELLKQQLGMVKVGKPTWGSADYDNVIRLTLHMGFRVPVRRRR